MGYVGIEEDYYVSVKSVLDITAETGALTAQSRIRELTPAGVAPVVRCKDCKLRRVDGYCTKFQNNILGIAVSWFVPEDDGFCSYGKPREE